MHYAELAKQSPTLNNFKRQLSTRGVTPEASKEWQKAMTAWRALEATRPRAREGGDAPGTRKASAQDVDYASLAHQFCHRTKYERYLVRELGLKPGTTEWERASRDYELKEHLDDQQRRPDRAPRRDPEERRAIERVEDRLIQVARECRSREEFDQYLRQELRYDPGSVK